MEVNQTQQPFPGEVHPAPGGGIMLSKLDDVINWARSNSLWPLTLHLLQPHLNRRSVLYCILIMKERCQ